MQLPGSTCALASKCMQLQKLCSWCACHWGRILSSVLAIKHMRKQLAALLHPTVQSP
jgi:hypothetical protein